MAPITNAVDDSIDPAGPTILLSELPSVTQPAAQKSNSSTHSIAAEQDQPPSPARSKKAKWRLAACMAALVSAQFIAALNQTIVATAVPTICAELDSAAGYAWIGGAAILASGTASPIWIKISDIFGRKPILLAAVATYFMGSIICATAVSMAMLIVGRAVQGTAAGGLLQLTTVTLSDLFSMRRRPLFFALIEVSWIVAAGTGPVLGGVFTEMISWRWIFWISLPVAGTTFFMLLFLLDVHNPRTKLMDGLRAIDWLGGLSIVGLMVMVLLGLNFGGETLPWNSVTVICLIVFGTLMSLVFIYCEKRVAKYPIMPMDLFKQKSNVAILVVGFTHDFAVIAADYYLPLYFQSVMGASPTKSGYMILPLMVGASLTGVVAAVVIHQTGRYVELIWIGITILVIGNGLFITLDPDSSLVRILLVQIVAGIGEGNLFLPPMIGIQAAVEQKDCATATATLGFVRSIAISLAVVLGGIVFQNGMTIQAARLEAEGLPKNITSLLSGTAAAANVMLPETIQDPRQKYLAKDSFAWSLRNIWIMCTCLVACGVIASVFIKKHTLSKEHTETKTGLDMAKAENVES